MTGKVPGTHHFRTCRSLPRSVTMIHNTTLLSQVVTISSLDQFFTSEAMTLKVNCFWDWKVTHEGINYARFGPYVGEVKKLSTRSSSSPYIPSTPWSSSAVPRNNVMNFPTKKDFIAIFFFRIAVHFVRCAILGTFGISTFIGSSSTLAATSQLCGSRPITWGC